MKKICVFLGSVKGNNNIYIQAAKELAIWIAKNNCSLVYGGSKVGIMGVLAEAVLKNGGSVEGFACKSFEKVLHPNLSKVHIFNHIADRKTAMIEYSDIFVTFPGGLGTLDELFEVWTLAKASLLNKPIGILNINNIFTPLHQAVEKLASEGFITKKQFKLLLIGDNVKDLMCKLFPEITNFTYLSQ